VNPRDPRTCRGIFPRKDCEPTPSPRCPRNRGVPALLGLVALGTFLAILFESAGRCRSPELAKGFGVLMGAWLVVAVFHVWAALEGPEATLSLSLIASILTIGCWLVQLVM